MELKVDELRIDAPRHRGDVISTGIFVRAKYHDKYGSYDISELDGPSLLAWLRSRGGENPWAENTVGILLGHKEPLVPKD